MRIDHETAVVNSALWAAAGDALGWMTELGREGTVVARTGKRWVNEPIEWRRRIGGRGGVDVLLPAGTYSDDTQLRLAVCRSMRGRGDFDAEAFARVELTVWPSYALGAGRGSKAAAANLAKRGTNWFSNFFVTKDQNYLRAGGNGAAMRIQPHVWSNPSDISGMVLSVMKDSVSTHGHIHGFGGAVFHALCLSIALNERKIPDLGNWLEILHFLHKLPELLQADGPLSSFWLPAWTQAGDRALKNVIEEFVDEAGADLDLIKPLLDRGVAGYHDILSALGCFDDRYRGSGWKTALAAAALSWICREVEPELAMEAAANALGSDTDTIATMAGALVGAVVGRSPIWTLQDESYLVLQAQRMAAMANGSAEIAFRYPDLSDWRPPASQSDATFAHIGGLAVIGLGAAEIIGKPHAAGGFVWQWLKLPFGQTVFAKRRAGSLPNLDIRQLPVERQPAKLKPMSSSPQLPLPPIASAGFAPVNGDDNGSRQLHSKVKSDAAQADRLDRWTDEVIKSDFDDHVFGRLLNRYIDEVGSIEGAASFVAIIAKAKLSRQRREARR